jgi:hypothetical protein
MSDFYNSGYSGGDWYALRDAVLLAAMKDAHGKIGVFDELPPYLRKTEIGDLVYQAVYRGHKKAAAKAAKLLVGGADKCWLILEKG